jgi:hypothetical protein
MRRAELERDLDAARKTLLAPSDAERQLALVVHELDRLRAVAISYGIPPKR